jgi:signal peptidase I
MSKGSKKTRKAKQQLADTAEAAESGQVDENQSAAKEAPQKQTLGQWLGGWAKSIVIALLIWFVLQALVLKSFRIISDSLEPTLLVGDWLFINKALYGAEIPLTNVRTPAFRQPRAGELIVLTGIEDPPLTIVKRVIGVAGDTLQMRGDSIFRNGEHLVEPYVRQVDPTARMDQPQRMRSRSWQLPHLVDSVDADGYLPDLRNWGPFVIPEGHLFTMGDNRDHSYDGRHWGFLPRQNVIGHPMFIYFSYDPTVHHGGTLEAAAAPAQVGLQA